MFLFRALYLCFALLAVAADNAPSPVGLNKSALDRNQQNQQHASQMNQLALNSNRKHSSAFKSIPTIEVFGNKFFYSNNGSQFFLRGIAYQPDYNIYKLPQEWDHDSKSYIDPLAIPEMCQRDIKNLRALNVNTIRVYALDPKADHDFCMSLLAENHIYVVADLSEPKTSIYREMPSWDLDLYERYIEVVNAMLKYNNVLGFFAGNEVVTNTNNTMAAPFVKASIRDTKRFIKERKLRKIPIGYSANDDALTRDLLKTYMICGEDELSKLDFLGVNNYEWCGHSTFKTSGYSERLEDFKNYPIPVFFSEFGCNTVRPRPFTEVDSLFSPLMTDTFSGGIMYMFFEEPNNYGIVKVSDLNNITSSVEIMEEFKFLQYQYGKVNTQGINKKSYSSKKVKTECPTASDNWKASAILPNKPDLFRCDCVMSALTCTKSPTLQLTVEEVKDIYSEVCQSDTITCSKLKGDGLQGVYGIYSNCRKGQRLSILMNEYYFKNGQNASACAFGGKATKIGTKNTIDDLFHINDPFKSDKSFTCFKALGGEKHIKPLYGIFGNESQTENEDPTASYKGYDKKPNTKSSEATSYSKLGFANIIMIFLNLIFLYTEL